MERSVMLEFISRERFLERIWFYWKFICRELSSSKKIFFSFLVGRGKQLVERIRDRWSISRRGTVCRRNLVLLKFFSDFSEYISHFEEWHYIFFFNISEQFFHVVCPLKVFSYMSQVSTFNENVFHSVLGLACRKCRLLLFFQNQI